MAFNPDYIRRAVPQFIDDDKLEFLLDFYHETVESGLNGDCTPEEAEKLLLDEIREYHQRDDLNDLQRGLATLSYLLGSDLSQ